MLDFFITFESVGNMDMLRERLLKVRQDLDQGNLASFPVLIWLDVFTIVCDGF